MSYIFILLAFLSLAQLIWGKILKKSAYPAYIPTRIKLFHAVILLYVLLNGLSDFWSLLSVIFRPQLLTEIGGVPNGYLVDTAYVTNGVTGTILLFVCSRMAKREKEALKWYFILWPTSFLASVYLMSPLNMEHYPIQVLLLTGALSTVLFILTVIFYLLPSTRVIWSDA